MPLKPLLFSILLISSSAFAENPPQYDEYKRTLQQLEQLRKDCKASRKPECDTMGELNSKARSLREVPEVKKLVLTDERSAAFDRARAYCPQEKLETSDRAMKFEIELHKPELEKHRESLDRPKFCMCRADERLKAYGKELAGSYYMLADDSDLTAGTDLKATLAKEKEIFISCFEKSI